MIKWVNFTKEFLIRKCKKGKLMGFCRRHWFKMLIFSPFFSIGILIASLDRFIGIDESLRFLISFVLIVACLLLLFFGFYLELNKRDVENKKIKFSIGNFSFGLADIGRIVLGILAIVFFYITYDFATMSVRVANVIDSIASSPDIPSERMYSLVTMSNFNVHTQGSYGRIGVSAVMDEATDKATEEFLYQQNFIRNPIQTPFDSPFDMLNALYSEEIDAIIIGSNFAQVFDDLDSFRNIEQETLVLDQFTIEVEAVERIDIDLGEPFSILLLGINSREEISSGVGQINTFMLLTINLEKLSFTATSIPRDSYVPIPCFNHVSDKLSHTNVMGPHCAVGAIEHMFDMEIPYYVKLNFTGFMEIIDILGGIEIDVPYSFSEQDSRRRFGEHLIHVEAGMQRLNAEEALALTRHRGWDGGDFTRVQNQQLVFYAMLQEMLNDVNGISDVLPFLEVIGRHVDTNLSSLDITTISQHMLGLLQGRKASDLIEDMHFINMVILGDTPMIDVRYHGNLSVVLPWSNMISDARKLMKVNLGLEEPEFSFTFEFDGFTRQRRQWLQIDQSYEFDFISSDPQEYGSYEYGSIIEPIIPPVEQTPPVEGYPPIEGYPPLENVPPVEETEEIQAW